MTDTQNIEIREFVDMVSAMASLNFSNKIETKHSDGEWTALASGLNMLSEELESGLIHRSILEERNADLERFAFTVAHDLRAPVNATLGLISLIQSDLERSDLQSAKASLELLARQQQNINSMIEGILQYTRSGLNNTPWQEIDIRQMCEKLAGELRPHYSLQMNYDLAAPGIHFNRVALRQVLSNLFGNAVQHCDKHTCIISITTAATPSHFSLSIRDNGPGIPAEKLGKIFDLFENFRSTNTGSFGIGLSVVQKIITQAQGRISVTSTIGEGTTFSIELPLSSPNTKPPYHG